MVAKEVLRVRNYAALWRMWRHCAPFHENLARYLAGRGDYPYECRIRTPEGIVAPTLFSRHDMWTVNEVFCRQDYGNDRQARAVIDIGSNIGISALFFLTRNPHCRAWLYEPVPRNAKRLRENLAGYGHRYSLREAAVGAREGPVAFGVEESGRYGGIGVHTGRSIEVPCVSINRVVEEVLETVPAVDVLKIDTEGSELEILRALRPDLLRKVRTVYLEVMKRPREVPEPFDASFHNETWVLRNSALGAPVSRPVPDRLRTRA